MNLHPSVIGRVYACVEKRRKQRPTSVKRPDKEEDQAATVSFGERSPQQRSDTVAGNKDGNEQHANFFRYVVMLDDGRDQARRRRRGEGCVVQSPSVRSFSGHTAGLAVVGAFCQNREHPTCRLTCVEDEESGESSLLVEENGMTGARARRSRAQNGKGL